MEKEQLKEALREVIDEKKSEFWVDAEIHYQHHQFISNWMAWSDNIKSTTVKTIVRVVVSALLALMAVGFYCKWKGGL